MNRIRYDEVTGLIAGLEPACGGTTVVAIDGPSGAGKTGLADELAARTGAVVLHLEDVYPGWTGLAATPPAVLPVLERIAVGEIGHVHRWDWVADRQGPVLSVPPAPLLILDGVGSGAALLRPYLSLMIWLDAPLTLRKRRALDRDGDVYAPFWEIWADQEAEHFAAENTRAHADLVIDTGD